MVVNYKVEDASLLNPVRYGHVYEKKERFCGFNSLQVLLSNFKPTEHTVPSDLTCN